MTTVVAYRRVAVAYADADPKPDVITLPMMYWYEMLDALDARVMEAYATKGFYQIGTRKAPLSRQPTPGQPSVPAFTYKGVPVVAAEDYADMMDGHRSRRIVLAV
jgi:hypothetical protein